MEPATAKWLFVASMTVFTLPGLAQRVTGHVTNESGDPIPYVHIYIPEIESGATTDEKGQYFLTLDPGIYKMMVSSIGYETISLSVIVRDKTLVQDITLKASSLELEQVVVRAKRKDPAYEIIQFVIDNKERYLKQVSSARSQVYIKAIELLDEKEKDKKEKAGGDENLNVLERGPPIDEMTSEKAKEKKEIERTNFLELQLTLNYKYPDLYKEERTAYKSYGDRRGLFVPLFSETDFNFYNNLVSFKDINDVPVISPFSRTSILSYKFKLEEIRKENGDVVYKIKVTPRKSGNATAEGYVYVNDSTWNINRLELTLHKSGLKFYDVFTIRQQYHELQPGVWMPDRQEFLYETKVGGRKTFRGNTVIYYKTFERDFVFPEKFFGNEVAVTTKEAYERDTSYWQQERPEPLTEAEHKVISYRDSVEAAHKDQHYLDSIEAQFNKVTLGEVLWYGISFRNDDKKSNIHYPALSELVNFEVVGGFRLGPGVRYSRRYENGKIFYGSTNLNIGLKNVDLQGGLYSWFRYDPFHLGDVGLRGGRNFQAVNSFDAYLNQLRISNFILHDYVHGFHRRELINGLFLHTELGFHNRRSVDGYDATSILNEVIDEDDPLVFENYQALISEIRISYTPGQRYMREPNRKVILGSNYPTFQLTHQKGWNGLLGSDINFDYLEFLIKQNFTLGTLGNTNYTLQVGKFVNTKDLRYIDVKRFRESDPYLYSTPLYSFQLLDTSLFARDLYFEAHLIHHFNGALVNNIPLLKKTGIRTVAGAGLLWVKESSYRYEELFAGVERIFKLGKRRRLRLGIYGVAGESNYTSFNTGYKVSFDIIDTWKRNWSY